ncbi:MAG: hypothetical protein RMJ32_06115, partial [Aquificaceae bacterium]|nr:hypothetical protein [Aquificaceae bacterium]
MFSFTTFEESELKKRLKKNLNIFRSKLPDIASHLELEYGLKVKIANGKIDAINKNGTSIYNSDAVGVSKMQVEQFLLSPTRILPGIELLNEDSQFDETLISHRFSKKIMDAIGNPVFLDIKPLNETKFASVILMQGLGFGFHLDFLVEEIEIANLIIIDRPEFFKLSLIALDWERVFDYFSKDRTLFFLFHTLNEGLEDLKDKKDLELVYGPLLTMIREINPGVFHWGYFFQHLNFNKEIGLAEWLNSSNGYPIYFTGYTDDEIWSLDWSIQNFKKGIPLLNRASPIQNNTHAFVVGSGPSLDKTIKLIEKYQNK